jgi:peptide/nickel transport system substrate-binding protein
LYRQTQDMVVRKIFAIACLLLAALLGGCAQARPPSEGTLTGEESPSDEAPSREIVVALAQAPASLDPADHRDRTAESVIRNMFDGLVTRDTRNGVHLELAEEMNWLDDRTLEIRLRQGVLFHDGVEMTADDVVFTFNRIIQENAIEYPEPHSSPRRSLIASLQSIEKIDLYTLVMHFSAPWPPAMQLLVHQQIVPKHYVEAVGTQGLVEHPIGTGPFKFVSASPRLDEIVMERFEDYYGGAPDLPPVGPACVDRVVFRAVPDSLTRAAALAIGEVDIIQAVPLDLIKSLEQKPRVQVKTAPGTQPKWMEMNVDRPPFDDVRVRQALNYAVDKERIVDEVYGGRAVALPGPLSPFNNFVDKGLEPYPYDPTKALDLLAEAGWRDSDGDGVLDQNGGRLTFALDTLREWLPLAEAVADQLQQVGLAASVRTWEPDVIRPQMLAGRRSAYLDDWGDSAFDPVGHFEAKWHGYVEGQPYGRANFSGYNNERVNQLIVMGERTADADERQDVYDEAQGIIYEEAPAVFLILPEEIEAASVRVQNWEPASDSRINLHDVCVAP